MTPEQAYDAQCTELKRAVSLCEKADKGLVDLLISQDETITQLQEQVTELENHNKDKSQLLANYKEQITALVKEKHRREK